MNEYFFISLAVNGSEKRDVKTLIEARSALEAERVVENNIHKNLGPDWLVSTVDVKKL